jgi:dATP pyrophosphohydrolase
MTARGYRRVPRGGPELRTDIVDVYIFRRVSGASGADGDPAAVDFLQLLRSGDPMRGTWQPVMGHVERGETAVACAIRELAEEVDLHAGDERFIGLWALEQVHPYYIAAIDTIVHSPRFAAEVARHWQPTLNHEHEAHRWVPARRAAWMFMWPGQAAACKEITGFLLRGGPAAGFRPGSSQDLAPRVVLEKPAPMPRRKGGPGVARRGRVATPTEPSVQSPVDRAALSGDRKRPPARRPKPRRR